SNGQKFIEDSDDLLVVIIVFSVVFLVGLMVGFIWTSEYHKASFEYPQFSIEGITASNIDISSSSLTPYYSSLDAQNLTINFVVENRAPRQVEYKSMVVSVSYKGDILWVNTLDLYHQHKGERTSMQITFSNLPVKIKGDEVAKEMSTSTSGYGVSKVDLKGKYNSKKLEIHCGDVKIHQLSSSTTQE
ncbi:hypothetical protein A4A49_59326, partial [Nicotiana attenuata]